MGSDQQINMSDLKKVPMFWFGLMAQIMVFGGISFGSPVLAIHLGSYEGFTKAWIGFYFSAPAITYLINSLFISHICDRVHRRVVLLIGLILFSISIYMVGTSPMLGIDDVSSTILAGLFLMGFAAVMITVPLIPEILNSIESQLPWLEGEELNNVISGYLNSCIGIGEAIGPIASGLLTESLGFRHALDLAGTFILFFTLVYAICNISVGPCLREKPVDEEQDDYIRCQDPEIQTNRMLPSV